LALLYQEGKGVPKDNKKAIAYLTKALKSEYAPAMRHVSYMYKSGTGGAIQSEDEAQKWAEKAGVIEKKSLDLDDLLHETIEDKPQFKAKDKDKAKNGAAEDNVIKTSK